MSARAPFAPARSMGRTVTGLVLLATTVAACAPGGNGTGNAIAGNGATPTASTTAGTAGGSPTTSDVTGAAVPDALNFSAPLVGGGTLNLAGYAGSTVVFWFWAPG